MTQEPEDYGLIVRDAKGRVVMASDRLTRSEAERLRDRIGEGEVVDLSTLRAVKREMVNGR